MSSKRGMLPLIRFGIQQPSIEQFKIIVCIFSAYHALKAQVRYGKIKVESDVISSPTLRTSWSVCAQALSAEAGEMHIPRYAFSLPKFISCLMTGRRGPVQSPAVTDAHVSSAHAPSALHSSSSSHLVAAIQPT